jgi:acetyl esterase/lipase
MIQYNNKKGCKVEYRKIRTHHGKSLKIMIVRPEKCDEEKYPAAIQDSYQALLYMKNHADELGIRPDQIMVGGESAGGGLAAALCMYARDKKSVQIAFQMPLYPMLDCQDTPSSADNHAKVWNTRRNHIAWKLYLRSLKNRKIPAYASPSRCRQYENLPPAYTFVGDAEPFYFDALDYI